MGVLQRVTERMRSDENERPFECLGCGTYLQFVYHTCPSCGSFAIDRRAVTM